MSFGFRSYSSEIHKAMNDAYAKGVVMVAAASNNGTNDLVPLAFPARQLGIVICMNAADYWGNKSNFNPPPATYRDNFSILGENVESTWPTNIAGDFQSHTDSAKPGPWKRLSGTSVATPIAASVAASIIQFKNLHLSKIAGHSHVESFNGIRQIFARMTLDKSYQTQGGFDNIRPWEVLDYNNWRSEDNISGKISEELRKI